MRSPRALDHARWLIRANKIPRVYASTTNPTEKLTDMVKIVVFLYALGWFQIKSHPNVSDGARNFWFILWCF